MDFYPTGFGITFAKGTTQEDLLTRMGGDPASARMAGLDDADDWEQEDLDSGPVLRFGESHEWSFALENYGSLSLSIAGKISKGIKIVALSRLENAISRMVHAVDQQVLLDVDVSMLSALAAPPEGGLLSEIIDYSNSTSPGLGYMTAREMLRFAHKRFGLEVERDLIAGELLSCRIDL
ncbi:hypothetical protein [Phaeacidiphilus oryzae]|jgi:hypothetical protein|uniref:hypothetical protein n=1 Tax=Phaeacidiphilus oryzae TaxID=348818 RepID=UPI0005601934|nr:hypothetical protein [Phaeacidiphilus oryzae]